MANQIQTFWDSMPVELHAPSNNAAAALAINAWDNIGRGIGNLGTKLIEEPMSKLYRADLNAGRDISGYDPLALSNKVLEDTPTVRGQLLDNDTKAFDLAVKKADEMDAETFKEFFNQYNSLRDAGDIAGAQKLLRNIPLNMRPSVYKKFIEGLNEIAYNKGMLGVQQGHLALDRQRYANERADLAAQDEANRYLYENNNTIDYAKAVKDYKNGKISPKAYAEVAKILTGQSRFPQFVDQYNDYGSSWLSKKIEFPWENPNTKK